MKRRDFFKTGLAAGAFLFFSACKDAFEFSPYEIRLEDKYLGTTKKNLSKLEELKPVFDKTDKIKIALTADNHAWYDHFADAISTINRENAHFVIHGGDLTDWGLEKEYELCHRCLDDLNIPYLTVIGNHDYLAFGAENYKDMFGSLNYTYELKAKNLNIKFLFWNNVVWERRNKMPDFEWLDKNLQNRNEFDHVIVTCHIPPYTDQFHDENRQERYVALMKKYNVSMSIHGHNHGFEYYPAEKPYYENVNTEFLVIGSPKEGVYSLLEIGKDFLKVEKKQF